MRHRHQCEDCDTIWAHEQYGAEQVTEAEYNRLHDCPRCGRNQRNVLDYVDPVAQARYARRMYQRWLTLRD